MEAVLPNMPVHLLGTLFQTFSNAAHMYSLPTLRCHLKHFIFASCSTSTPSVFKVNTVSVLYKLLTYNEQSCYRACCTVGIQRRCQAVAALLMMACRLTVNPGSGSQELRARCETGNHHQHQRTLRLVLRHCTQHKA